MTGSRGTSVNVRGRDSVRGRGSSWVARAGSVIPRGSSFLARSRSVIGRARSAIGCCRSPARGLGGDASISTLGRGRSITRGGGSFRHGSGSPIRDILEGYSSPDRGSKSLGRSQSPKRAKSFSPGRSGGRSQSAQKPKSSGEGSSVPVLSAPGLSTTTTVSRALNQCFDFVPDDAAEKTPNAEENFVLHDAPKKTTNGEENSVVLDDAAQPVSNAAAKKKKTKTISTPLTYLISRISRNASTK